MNPSVRRHEYWVSTCSFQNKLASPFKLLSVTNFESGTPELVFSESLI